MKLYVLMEWKKSFNDHKFIGVYDGIKNLTTAAKIYREQFSSQAYLYFNEINLNDKPNNIIKQSELKL